MSLEYWLVEHTLNRDCNRSGTNTIIKTQTLCRSTYHMSLSQCPLCYHPYHPRKKFHPPPPKKNFFFDPPPPPPEIFVVGGGSTPPSSKSFVVGGPKMMSSLGAPPPGAACACPQFFSTLLETSLTPNSKITDNSNPNRSSIRTIDYLKL